MRRFTALVFGSLCAFAVGGAPNPSRADDQAIVLSPDLPATVAVPQKNPNLAQLQTDFDVFSWQTFVALNWPARGNGTPNTDVTIGQQGALSSSVWEYWKESIEVFKDDGSAPSPWGASRTVRPSARPWPLRMAAKSCPTSSKSRTCCFPDPAIPDWPADRSERAIRPVRDFAQQIHVRLHRRQRTL